MCFSTMLLLYKLFPISCWHVQRWHVTLLTTWLLECRALFRPPSVVQMATVILWPAKLAPAKSGLRSSCAKALPRSKFQQQLVDVLCLSHLMSLRARMSLGAAVLLCWTGMTTQKSSGWRYGASVSTHCVNVPYILHAAIYYHDEV